MRLEEGRKEFLAWAGGPDAPSNDLLAKFLEFRKKVSGNEANMDWWVKNKTPKDLEDFMKDYKSKSAKRKEEMAGGKKIYDKDGWMCIHCTTYNAMKHYGKGTKWCIAGNYPGHEERGEYYFKNYLENKYSGYFVVINNNIKSSETSDSFVNNKWCVCPTQDQRDGSAAGGKADIWNAPDNTVAFIPGVPEIEGLPSLGAFTIIDSVLTKCNVKRGYDLEIPSDIIAIGNKAFMARVLDSSILIPQSVKKVGVGAFAGTNIADIVLAGAEELGHSCFLGCDNLARVRFKSNVKELPRRLFGYCDSLEDVTFEGVVSSVDPAFLEGTDTKGLRIYIHENWNDALIAYGRENNVNVVDIDTSEILSERR